MERKVAIATATAIAMGIGAAALAVAANVGVFASNDHVGKLRQPDKQVATVESTTKPKVLTVYVDDPAQGSSTTSSSPHPTQTVTETEHSTSPTAATPTPTSHETGPDDSGRDD
ncbi:MAG: hypothetical protein ACXVQX_12850 [Actinomycetota bacterium]